MLPLMQTVTRVGVPKWRGWHCNTAGKKSDIASENVLRPVNWVDVWIDPILFAEVQWMASVKVFYSAFCAMSRPCMQLGRMIPKSTAPMKDKVQVHHRHLHNLLVHTNMSAIITRTIVMRTIPVRLRLSSFPSKVWMLWNMVRWPDASLGRGQYGQSSVCRTNYAYFNEGDLVWIHDFHVLTLL
jgi:hypothetical protein